MMETWKGKETVGEKGEKRIEKGKQVRERGIKDVGQKNRDRDRRKAEVPGKGEKKRRGRG